MSGLRASRVVQPDNFSLSYVRGEINRCQYRSEEDSGRRMTEEETVPQFLGKLALILLGICAIGLMFAGLADILEKNF